MAGTMFVVCVPTKEHEADLLDQQQQPRRIVSTGSFGDLGRAAEALGIRPSTRSKSEDSLFISGPDGQEDGGSSRREMFIGPWRVDASDLPSLTPRSRSRSGRPDSRGRTPVGTGTGPLRRSRSPLLDAVNISRSEPEGLGAKTAETPFSNYKKRRHRFLESELEKVLQELKIHNAVWCMGRSNRFYQVLFSIESGDPCEEALQKLAERGIGVLLNSVVSVLPCVLYYQGSEKSGAGSAEDLTNDLDKDREDECPGSTGTGGGGRSKAAEQGTWERFVQSVRARLTVAQVVEGVRANATFNFDFLLLVTVAAFVAALGLFEDSTVILVASTLISPLMGPVMAATFGTMIRDWHLQRMGLINECVGLLHCLLIAFLTGVVVSFLDQPMPTAAMVDGGLLRSLWVNVLIATLSGMGIAIALLRDNTGSLVGVAISASLLPPAVNAGLLWAMSLVYCVLKPSEQERDAPYTAFYSDSPEIEMAVMGGVSLCTTFINIVFVYITGILMLKVKEVAPNSQAHQRFWKHDVKIARDYNTTLYGASAAEMLRSVVNQENCGRGSEDCCERPKIDEAPLTPELARLLQLSSGFSSHFGGSGGLGHAARARRMNPHYLDVCNQHQLTWSPSTFAAADPHRDPHRDQYHNGDTVRELEDLYRTIQHQHQLRQQHHLAPGQGQGQDHSRRSSFGSGTTATTAASWRLGRSDGYRCSLNKTPQDHGRGCFSFSRRTRRGVSTGTTASAASAMSTAAGNATGAASVPTVALSLTMCTPPYNNMPAKHSALFPDPVDVGDPGDPEDPGDPGGPGGPCTWATTPVTSRPPQASVSAFKTPFTAIGTPTSAFLTPIEGGGTDSSTSCSSVSTAAAAPRTVMTVDNETGNAAPHRPSKKRRFVVTKADDTQVLLPRK